MAVATLLFVKDCASGGLDEVKSISVNEGIAIHTTKGDNARANYVGRAQGVTGTVQIEDYTAAAAIIGTKVESVVLNVHSATGAGNAATLTLTGAVFTRISDDLMDGTQDGDVPTFGVDYSAASAVYADAT